METKVCKKCGKEKNIDEFRKEKRVKSGLQAQCKMCEKEYRIKKEEELKKYNKEYYKKNKQKLLEQSKIYRSKNKEKIRIRDKNYRKNNRDKINKRNLLRKQEDYIYKLKCNIRGIIKNSFRRRGFKKKQKGEEIYGCAVNELIEHLIKTYEDNYNEKWSWDYLKDVHVDHIIPLAIAKTEEEVFKLCHYTNLQLLKAKDNLDKKDKLDWELKI